MMKQETIISAAIMHNGTPRSLPPPARHHDIIHLLYKETEEPVTGEQGFLSSRGRFIDREEARELVLKNGQCKAPRHDRELFSEDLW